MALREHTYGKAQQSPTDFYLDLHQIAHKYQFKIMNYPLRNYENVEACPISIS